MMNQNLVTTKTKQEILLDIALKNKRKILGMVGNIIGDFSQAEDVFQEICILIIKRSHQFREEAAPATYLYRIATNAALMYRRKLNDACRPLLVSENGISELPQCPPTPEQTLIAKDSLLTLYELVPLLKFKILLMKAIGFSMREIETIGLSGIRVKKLKVGGIKTKFYRTVKEARKILDMG